MKKTILIALAAMLLMACQSGQKHYVQNGPEEVGTYTVTVIEPDIYHLQDYNSAYPVGVVNDSTGQPITYNNCSDMYLLVGEKAALLIDLSNKITWADNGEESLRKAVSDRIGNLPLIITCTHNHGDHIGMVPAYREDTAVRFVMPRVDFEQLPELFPADQLELFDEGYTFDLGGLKLHTLMVPGHTAGSMLFFVEGKDLCFSGDAIGSGEGVWIFSKEGFLQYAQAVPKLLAYLDDPANGINKEQLVFWGGHYHQRAGLDPAYGETIGYNYVAESAVLIEQILDGTADYTPVNFIGGLLNASFRYRNAGIVWNEQAAASVREE